MLYDGIGEVLKHAKGKGMITTLTTNGTLLGEKCVSELARNLDLLAISLDGPPEAHNRIRRSANAFKLMQSGLEFVRESKIRFGFIHTLTKESWEYMTWITDFAVNQGASLLQLHPLELFGRARTLMRHLAVNDEILGKAFLLKTVLSNKYMGKINLQLDVFHRDAILANPEMVYSSELGFDADSLPSQMLSNLVVEPSGTVVPVSFGFSREYSVCNVKNKGLRDSWPRYVKGGTYEKFRRLCKAVFDEISAPKDIPLFNWYDLVVSRSYGGNLS